MDSGSAIDFTELNPQQLAAVNHGEGPLSVIAGAGSGKTSVLVYRTARLIECGVAPEEILLLAFTRKAAQQMLGRVAELAGEAGTRVAGGTFHSFAYRMLREHGWAMGIPPAFTILDRADMEDALRSLYPDMTPEQERRFPQKDKVADLISKARNKSWTLAYTLERASADSPALENLQHLREHQAEITALAEWYDTFKREHGLLDFDDLLCRLAELLKHDESVRQQIAGAYRFVMIDEYQDTNSVQAKLVRLLAGVHENVMAVGDDAQSIYGWRGANSENLHEFGWSLFMFSGGREIRLEENYRSTQSILDLANAVIADSPAGYGKHLFSRRGKGQKPILVQARDDRQQSRFVAQHILELRKGGVTFNEIAVLFHSKFDAIGLVKALADARLPFTMRGVANFLEKPHVRDVLAYLRVIINPADAVSWRRLLAQIEGLGNRNAKSLAEQVAISAESEKQLIAAVKLMPKLSQNAIDAWTRLASLLGELHKDNAPADQLGHVIEYYRPILRAADSGKYIKRERDLEQLRILAEPYDSLEAMLADLALEPPEDSIGDGLAPDNGEARVTLSTVHSAKGLEWRYVFVIWLAEGRFPFYKSVSDEELEEERRLLYVAITRAQDGLYLTYPGQMLDHEQRPTTGRPSRFLAGLSETIIPALALKEGSPLQRNQNLR